MRRIPISGSTTIASVGYDPGNRELELEFRESGDVYRYLEVPAEEYAGLMASPSLGTYLNQALKQHGYRYLRIRKGRKRT